MLRNVVILSAVALNGVAQPTPSNVDAINLAALLEQIEDNFAKRLSLIQTRLSAAEAEIAKLRDCSRCSLDAPDRLQDDAIPSEVPRHGTRRLTAIERNRSKSHHVLAQRSGDGIMHQFADVNACLGGVMTSSYGTVLATADGMVRIIKQDETELKKIAPAFVMHHAGDCSGPPTVHAEVPLHAEGGLEVFGSLRVGGVDVALAANHSTFNPAPKDACIKVETGTESNNEGYLHVFVADASGFDNVVVSDTHWEKGETVVDMCFVGFRALRMHGPNTNAWTGQVRASTDGGTTWTYMKLVEGSNGAVWQSGSSAACAGDSSKIAFDQDADAGAQAPCQCANGKYCTLVLNE